MPSPHRRPTEVFDRVSATYDQVDVGYFSVFGSRLVEVAGVRTGERVLDVGAGRGAVTLPAARAVGATGRVTAIDLAPGMVRRLAEDVAGRGLRDVEVVEMDAQHPQLASASYDVVLASLVLFFLDDPRAALGRYLRLLRPGGRLGFTTFGGPVDAWRWYDDLQREFGPTGRTVGAPGHERFSTTEKTDTLVADAGFRDVRSVVEVHDVRFRDADQWWEWSWSHGSRQFWDSLPPGRVADARRAAYAHLAAIAEPDGSLVMRQPIRYTLGRRG